jgi:hypothetical protein
MKGLIFMITGSFSNDEIMEGIKERIENDKVESVAFNAIVFKDLKEIAFTVGLFINEMYILEEDIFETDTLEELKIRMQEIEELIYQEYGVKATYGIDYEGREGYKNVDDEKVS